MENPTVQEVLDAASFIAFGSPKIQNNFRAIVVEAIVKLALSPTWKHCSEDWNSWDFEHVSSGARLEVKQTAFRQSWKPPVLSKERRFDIAPRTGYWREGTIWTDKVGRHADIYVFAINPVEDGTVDHRDPSQWRFYVVETSKLPPLPQKSIGLNAVKEKGKEVDWHGLLDAVEQVRRWVPLRS